MQTSHVSHLGAAEYTQTSHSQEGYHELRPVNSRSSETRSGLRRTVLACTATALLAAPTLSNRTFSSQLSDPCLEQNIFEDEFISLDQSQELSLQQEPAVHKTNISLKSLKDLRSLIEVQHVEDGFSHPGEQMLRAYIQKHGLQAISTAVLSDDSNEVVQAAMLTLLGRVGLGSVAEKISIASLALKSTSVMVRDSAVQMVELWGDRELSSVLRKHHEREPWLAKYVIQVAAELEG